MFFVQKTEIDPQGDPRGGSESAATSKKKVLTVIVWALQLLSQRAQYSGFSK